MKKTLVACICLIVGAAVSFGGLIVTDPIDTATNPTNSTLTNVSGRAYSGYLEAVAIEFSGSASRTASVEVATSGDGFLDSVNLYTNAALTAGGRFYVTMPTQTIGGSIVQDTNTVTRIPIAGDRFVVKTSANENSTNVRIRVFLILSE